MNRHDVLLLNRNASLCEFKKKTLFIDILKEAWTKMPMNRNGRFKNNARQSRTKIRKI